MLDTGLLCIAFIMPRSVPPILHGFSQEKLLDLIKSLFCIYWNKHVTSILGSAYSMYCIYWFMYISNHPWISEVELTLLWWSIFSMCPWIQLGGFFTRAFGSVLISQSYPSCFHLVFGCLISWILDSHLTTWKVTQSSSVSCRMSADSFMKQEPKEWSHFL